MAQRNHIAGSELPPLTGDEGTDISNIHNHLYLVLEQMRFELAQKDSEISALKKAIQALQE